MDAERNASTDDADLLDEYDIKRIRGELNAALAGLRGDAVDSLRNLLTDEDVPPSIRMQATQLALKHLTELEPYRTFLDDIDWDRTERKTSDRRASTACG
jgi:hypothetical protein